MSQTYSIEDFENDETRNQEQGENTVQDFNGYTLGKSHDIDFIKLDQSRQSFNYAYLVTFVLSPITQGQELTLQYTTHVVTVTGYCLDRIYESIQERNLIATKQMDERYASISGDTKEPFVKTIEIVER